MVKLIERLAQPARARVAAARKRIKEVERKTDGKRPLDAEPDPVRKVMVIQAATGVSVGRNPGGEEACFVEE